MMCTSGRGQATSGSTTASPDKKLLVCWRRWQVKREWRVLERMRDKFRHTKAITCLLQGKQAWREGGTSSRPLLTQMTALLSTYL